MMLVLGVDCGIRGGLAILDIDNGAAPQLVEATDIPVVGMGAKERVDAIALRDWLTKHKPQQIPLTVVEPGAWKRFHKLAGKGKEGGRQRALQLWPASHSMFARKLDHGRAEAGLIALYGARQ
jgi:hypothetical protein